MSVSRLSPARTWASDLGLIAAAATLAAGIGLLAARSATLAVEAGAALIVVPLVLARPRWVSIILVVSTFTGSFTVAGVTAQRFVAPLALVGVAALILRRPIRLSPDRVLMAAIAGYAIMAFSSLLWSLDTTGTLYELASLGISLVYIVALLVLVQEEHDLRLVLWSVAGSAATLGTWWIASYALGVDRRFNLAGDPNFFAALEVASLPLVLALARLTTGRVARGFLYLTVFIIAASVVASLSRGGLVALGVAVALLLLVPARFLFLSARHKLLVFALALTGLGVLGMITGPDLAHRFEAAVNDPSGAAGRGDLALAALHGYDAHPVLGLGFGAFKATSFDLLRTTPGVDLPAHLNCLEAGQTIRGAAGCTGQQVHNAYLESLAELGPLGLALFAAVLGATLWSLVDSVRASADSPRPGAAGTAAVAAALAVGVSCIAVSSFSISTETSRALWLLVGLALVVHRFRIAAHRRPPIMGPQTGWA